MELIVAVYDNWGIGRDGTQPVALSADRRFFRETTRGAAVIMGRKTALDFPGQKPLPSRRNILLTRSQGLPGFLRANSVEEAAAMAGDSRTVVIGGGSVYRQMLPLCDRAYVTKVHLAVPCDTFFPDLDADPDWTCSQVLQAGEEDGVAYEMCLYLRK